MKHLSLHRLPAVTALPGGGVRLIDNGARGVTAILTADGGWRLRRLEKAAAVATAIAGADGSDLASRYVAALSRAVRTDGTWARSVLLAIETTGSAEPVEGRDVHPIGDTGVACAVGLFDRAELEERSEEAFPPSLRGGGAGDARPPVLHDEELGRRGMGGRPPPACGSTTSA